MKSTADFLDDLRTHFALPSDSKLALHMNWERQQLSRYRMQKSTFDDRTAIKVAAALGIEPDYIMACMSAQRARTPEARSAWERIAAKVAAGVLVALTLAGFDISSFSFQSVRASPALPEYTYQPIGRRRREWGKLGRYVGALAFSRLVWTLGLALALVSPARAGDWTAADTGRQAVFSALAIADWAQTRTIVRKDYIETNTLLGAHPSIGQVNSYFALALVGDGLIAAALPRGFRDAFQYLSIGVELDAVRHNYKVGIGFTF